MSIQPSIGTAWPLGATVVSGGVNFSVFSKNADSIELLLFDEKDQEPSRKFVLHPTKNRTYHYWHIFVPGIGRGQIYAYRVDGPYQPDIGMRFDPDKVLLDPYGKAVVVPERYDRMAARRPGDNCATAMKNVVIDRRAYDWEGDKPLVRPFARTIIYEAHVRGFTANPNSGVGPDKRGTYAGLIEKIPYLKQLGVTAVELLPVFHFDEQDAPPGFKNYWGYSPISFFAVHPMYSSRKDPLGPINEFRDMVKALHKSGIEVILDVVYNHTAEGDEHGPTLSFKGFENSSYYLLENNGSRYANYSGCGNTLDADSPFVRRLIIDSIRYWVKEMHIDGFRFDLASILARDENGMPLKNPAVLWDLETDPEFSSVKLIAEAWDAAGMYQVGSFVGDSWKEWNGKFRDDVRSFIKSDRLTVKNFVERFLGSPDIYGHEEREPEQSINFVTCHDGFTLNDVVSYDRKHNESNGEENRDGANDNLSWNCGIEGPTDNPGVMALRDRQIKNFLTVLLLSTGVPMISMGDEVRRTQNGNNNAYCQDNEISWFDWDLLKKNQDIFRFVQCLIAGRKRTAMSQETLRVSLNQYLKLAKIEWHGVKLNQPDWGPDSHSIAFTIRSFSGRFAIHLMVNEYWEALSFELPSAQGLFRSDWKRWIDTSLKSPEDICNSWDDAVAVVDPNYVVQPRSMVALLTRIV